MKTLTEFFGPNLKKALEQLDSLEKEVTQTVTDAMKAEGKPEEEITAGLSAAVKPALTAKLGEVFKLEGDKLTWFEQALALVKNKRGGVKRVLVGQLNEGEKAPAGYTEIEGKVYSVELFPEAARAAQSGREGRGDGRGERGRGKGGRGGKGKGRGDREGRGGGRGGRGRHEGAPRGVRPEGAPVEGAEGVQAGVAGEGGSSEGRQRRERRPRKPREPMVPYTGPNRIIPKDGTRIGAAAKAAGESAPAAAPTESSGESASS